MAQINEKNSKTEFIFKKPEDLKADPKNARTHDAKQVKKIAKSIKKFGFINPIIIDSQNMIIAGHGRLEGAKSLKLKEVPCILVDHLTEAEKQAYMLADNQIALQAGWDMDLLKVNIEELQVADFDLSFTGFDDRDFQSIFLDRQFGEVDKEKEWDNMPEYSDLDPCYRKVIVSFDDEDAVREFFKRIKQDYTEKTKSVWFPKKEKRDLKNKKWK